MPVEVDWHWNGKTTLVESLDTSRSHNVYSVLKNFTKKNKVHTSLAMKEQ